MSTKLRIESFDTPAPLYAALSRVFGEDNNNGTRWVKFDHDGVTLSFFAPYDDSDLTEVAIADAFTPPDLFSRKAG